MKVIVFGGSGFIGKRVVSILEEKGSQVVSVSRKPKSNNSVVADIGDRDSLDQIKDGFDAAIICSAASPRKQYQLNDVMELIGVNVIGILNVLDWARSRGVKKVVLASTLSMLPLGGGDPEGALMDTSSHYPYKISKAAGEHLAIGFCREHNISLQVLRLPAVYGPGMKPGVILNVIDKVNRRMPFELANQNLTADYVHLNDVAEAIVASVNSRTWDRIINISSGAPVRLYDLVGMVCKLMGAEPITVNVKSSAPVHTTIHSEKGLIDLIGRPAIPLERGIRDLISPQTT